MDKNRPSSASMEDEADVGTSLIHTEKNPIEDFSKTKMQVTRTEVSEVPILVQASLSCENQ